MTDRVWDALQANMTYDQIKKRGRWETDTSGRRYRKAGRLVKTFGVLPLPIAAYHQRCVEVVEHVILENSSPLHRCLAGILLLDYPG